MSHLEHNPLNVFVVLSANLCKSLLCLQEVHHQRSTATSGQSLAGLQRVSELFQAPVFIYSASFAPGVAVLLSWGTVIRATAAVQMLHIHRTTGCETVDFPHLKFRCRTPIWTNSRWILFCPLDLIMDSWQNICTCNDPKYEQNKSHVHVGAWLCE